MNQQHRKIQEIEVSKKHSPPPGLILRDLELPGLRRGSAAGDQIPRHAGGQTPGPTHDPIAQVIDMTCVAPPAGNKQVGSGRRRDGM